ncbi:hypothetical protein chiPu_0030392 [Chiloscyllium punctatum]|uniref:Uncharacterized protein n=1 Tax=Chiloscyllium punctatum TaxID=137246 RepID=A0A401TUR8_CHIPU|nr:hypothetical protein [Chiloscyllium punctatum]
MAAGHPLATAGGLGGGGVMAVGAVHLRPFPEYSLRGGGAFFFLAWGLSRGIPEGMDWEGACGTAGRPRASVVRNPA